MRLDINEINHNYIIKLVIFSMFLFKKHIMEYNIYNELVNDYIKKRVIWDINFKIEPFIIDKEYEREIRLKSLIEKTKDDRPLNINISFSTPIRNNYKMVINIKDESKYEKYIYS